MNFLRFIKIFSLFLVFSCIPKKGTITAVAQAPVAQVANWSCAGTDMDVSTSTLSDAPGVLTTSLKPNLLCRWQSAEANQCKFSVESLPLSCSENVELCQRFPSYFKGCQIKLESADLMISASNRKHCQKNGKTVTCRKSCDELSKNILVKVSYKSDCSRRY